MRIPCLLYACLYLIACGESTPKAKPAVDPSADARPSLITEKIDTALAGTWVLEALPQSPTPLAKLYPRQRPVLFIQPEQRLLSGSTGCNRFSASLTTTGNRITITGLTSSTLVCPGDAEANFLKAMEKSTQYSFRKKGELVWGTDSTTWMVFRRR